MCLCSYQGCKNSVFYTKYITKCDNTRDLIKVQATAIILYSISISHQTDIEIYQAVNCHVKPLKSLTFQSTGKQNKYVYTEKTTVKENIIVMKLKLTILN